MAIVERATPRATSSAGEGPGQVGALLRRHRKTAGPSGQCRRVDTRECLTYDARQAREG